MTNSGKEIDFRYLISSFHSYSYMFGKDCFMVKCFSEKGCRVIPDEDLRKSTDAELRKEVQYVIKRQYGVRVGEGMTVMIMGVVGHGCGTLVLCDACSFATCIYPPFYPLCDHTRAD